jgi:uncharacterized protein (UPF0332 family)
MTKPARGEVLAFMQEARDALKDAELLLEKDRLKGAVSRAYYAVFNAARAMLAAQGMGAKTHKGTIRLFHLHLIKDKLVTGEMGVILSDLHEERELADYHAMTENFERIDVERDVAKAKEFVEMAERFIKK